MVILVSQVGNPDSNLNLSRAKMNMIRGRGSVMFQWHFRSKTVDYSKKEMDSGAVKLYVPFEKLSVG